MRQISTRICVSRERFGVAIFFFDEKTATPFHQSMTVYIKQILLRVNLRVQLFVASKNRLRSNGIVK